MPYYGDCDIPTKRLELSQWLTGCEQYGLDIYISTSDKTINYNGDRTIGYYHINPPGVQYTILGFM